MESLENIEIDPVVESLFTRLQKEYRAVEGTRVARMEEGFSVTIPTSGRYPSQFHKKLKVFGLELQENMTQKSRKEDTTIESRVYRLSNEREPTYFTIKAATKIPEKGKGSTKRGLPQLNFSKKVTFIFNRIKDLQAEDPRTEEDEE